MSERTGDHANVGLLDVVAFLCELTMLALLAVTGWAIGDGLVARIGLAVLLLVAAGTIWGIWMAPTSGRRLRNPLRLLAQAALFVATGAIAVVAGFVWWGVAFAVAATVIFTARREA